MIQVDIYQAKTHFSKLIKQVINGEEIIIAKGNKPIARLVPFKAGRPTRKLDAAKGKIIISPDFDEPIDGFADYT